MSDAAISSLPGIGPATQRRLDEAGIGTLDALRAIGSVEAYRRLRFMFHPQVSLNALYAIEGALRGCHWLDLPSSVTKALRQEARMIDDALRGGRSPRCAVV
jgi:DNA transformation protein